MITKEKIRQMRTQMSDDAIMSAMYQQDMDFKGTVDKFKPHLQTMPPVVQANFAKAMINKQYFGGFGGDGVTPSSPSAVSAYNSAAQSAVTAQAKIEKHDRNNAFGSREGSSVFDRDPNFKMEDFSLGETVSNIPESAWEMVKGLGSAIAHPIRTVSTLKDLAVGGGINAVETIAGAAGYQNAEDMFNRPEEEVASQVGKFYVERYGSLEAAAQTLQNDPVGFLADAATVVTGVGGLVKGGATVVGNVTNTATRSATALNATGRAVRATQAAGNTIARAGIAMEPIVIGGKVTRLGVGLGIKGVQKGARFGTAQMSGLSPSTLDTIMAQPSKFDELLKSGELSRGSMGERVLTGIGNKMDEISETGKAYDAIRKSTQAVDVPTGWFDDLLRKKGFDIDDAGKIKVTTESIPLTGGELKGLQDLHDLYFAKSKLSPTGVLNTRTKMTDLSKFKVGVDKTDDGTRLFREIRHAFNDDIAHPQLTALKKADDLYTPQITELNALKKEFMTKSLVDGVETWTLKDNALSKIANAQGKNNRMNLLKQVVPDIDTDLKILKAIEDVEYATGHKVGTYMRSAATIGGVASGNVPVAVMGILASPQNLLPIITRYAKLRNFKSSVVNKVVNKLKMGRKLNTEEAGMVRRAMESVEETFGVKPRKGGTLAIEDIAAMTDDIDDVPLSAFSPQGVADAAAGQKILDAGGSVDDAVRVSGTPIPPTGGGGKAPYNVPLQP